MITNLRMALPIETEAYSFVCEQEIKQKAQAYYALWRKGLHTDSVRKMLSLYDLIVSNEYQVSDDHMNDLMIKMLRYFRIFTEELLFEFENQSDLKILIDASKELIQAHGNYDLRSLIWETYFFSTEFKHQVYAMEMFQELPQLPRHLNFDHLLKRAGIYKQENYYRKLLEIALKFDLDDYEKKQSLEHVLIFYSK